MNKPPSDLIKKIPVDRLRKGMFVHDLDCSWLDHPFATSAFLVTTEQRIQVIRSLGIHDVYIDPSKGLDVEDAPTQTQVVHEIEDCMARIASEPVPPPLRRGRRR